jgi:hypothetical protein
MPWAARNRNSAFTASSPSITPVAAGPISAARRRHQAGVRWWKAIFSGG